MKGKVVFKKSYNKKKWLLGVAEKVERQAKEYSNQIKNVISIRTVCFNCYKNQI